MDAEEQNEFSIVCSDMPDSLFDNDAAVEHFGKFGTVTKIVLQPKKMSCIISYESREGASKAVMNAGAYDGFMFDVKLNKKKRPLKKEEDPEWLPPPDVAAELEAMDAVLPRLNRQQKMDLDAPSPVISKKKPLIKKMTGRKEPAERKKFKISPTKPNETDPIVPAKPLDRDDVRQLFAKTWSTTEDKLAALEIRNRIFRTHLLKRQGAIKGCCPDMCPERERLLRQSQRQFSSYECFPFGGESSVFDPKHAVKEYSRSSADQEEPLPNELRPVAILHKTLVYLLEYIMELSNQPETSLADWFHFTWDRLRALRKDITQQALCCEGSLLVVEACARFHAHCGARLIEEPPSSFDQRLNTENLSKCLQSLKYMYNDLRTRGEAALCCNEPEFRAYVILLNLNDANFMWEVQHLPLEVQSSPEVSFAIKVFTALDNNNYVKFFKLVQQTTYLNACILHRYFNDVRTRALQRMIKAYSPRGVSYFPANDLVDVLGFESFDSMQYFVEQHGLQISMDQNVPFVLLDKSSFITNVSEYAQERAMRLVESKRCSHLGDIIYGSKLPPSSFDAYVPQSSFDDNNNFKKEAIFNDSVCTMLSPNVVQQIKAIIDNPSFVEKPSKIPSLGVVPDAVFKAPKPAPKENPFVASSSHNTKPFENKSIFSTPAASIQSNQYSSNSSIFGNKLSVNANIFGSSKSVMSNQSNIFSQQTAPSKTNVFGTVSVAKPIFSQPAISTRSNIFGNVSVPTPIFSQSSIPTNIFGSVTVPFFDAEAQKIKEEEELKRRREEEAKRLEEEKRMKQLEEARQQVIEQARREEEEKRAASELAKRIQQEHEETERKQREFEERVTSSAKKLLPEIIDEVVNDICKTFLQTEQNKLREIINFTQITYADILDEICFEECKKSLHHFVRLNEIRQRILARCVVQKWKAAVRKTRKHQILLSSTPLWIPSRSPPLPIGTQQNALKRMRDFHRGNMIDLKVPDYKPVKKIDVFEEVKKSLLRRSQEFDKQTYSLNIYWKVTMWQPCKEESPKAFNSFRSWMSNAFGGEKFNNEYQTYLKSALWHKQYHISLCTVKSSKDEQMAMAGTNGLLFYGTTNQIIKRIEAAVFSKSEFECLPIAVIMQSNQDHFAIVQKHLIQLQNHKSISSFKIFLAVNFSPESLSTETVEALVWLSRNHPPKPPLETDRIHTFLDQCLGRELWHRFKIALCSPAREAFRVSKSVINLYNEAVDRTAHMVCNSDLNKYPVFAPEFKPYAFNDSIYPKDYEHFEFDWKSRIPTLRKVLLEFKVPPYRDDWATLDWPTFQSSMRNFIIQLGWFGDCERVLLKVMGVFVDGNDEDDAPVDFECSPEAWLKVMEILVTNKILSADLNGLKHVVYRKGDLSAFRSTPWWYRSSHVKDVCTFIRESDLTFLDDTLDSLGISPKRARMDSSLESVPDDEWLDAITEDMERIGERNRMCKRTMSQLEKAIEDQRAKQRKIEEMLKNALGDV